ncbi:MAG: YHS domain-containing protein [Spirochaetaceae bacterium]|nr:MAG: YHS domain-containing protein [Spirochaetaceae bacterium]
MTVRSRTHSTGYSATALTRWILLLAVLLMVPAVWSAAAGQHEGAVYTEDGVAIKGYDPVAYFTLGEPTQGSAQYSVEWDGAEWWFAGTEHRDMFADDPERYAPRYGGYCAYAAAQGSVSDIDPDQWAIEDGRLYLNRNARFHRRFHADLAANIAAADQNWPALRAKLEEAAAAQ